MVGAPEVGAVEPEVGIRLAPEVWSVVVPRSSIGSPMFWASSGQALKRIRAKVGVMDFMRGSGCAANVVAALPVDVRDAWLSLRRDASDRSAQRSQALRTRSAKIDSGRARRNVAASSGPAA